MKTEETTYNIDGIEYYYHEFTERPLVMPEDLLNAGAWVFGIITGVILLSDFLKFVGVIAP
jgi:hypothetical protein